MSSHGSLAFLTLVALACRTPVVDADRAEPNDNRAPAGTLRDGVLTLRLEAREARWYPDGDDGPSLVMQVFAEAGRQPQNPGPLIRVAAGTMVRLSVRNALRE